jgi:acyl carrier protein
MSDDKIKIKNFLLKSFNKKELNDDDNIFSLGFVDSLFAIELVIFIEKTFGIAVENEDLDLENFKSVNALCQLVKRKMQNKE